MLGFTAHALTTDIARRDDELEDAQWFTREDLKSGRPLVPPSVSISFRLIEHWFDAGGPEKLREIYKDSGWR
jgi:NAD+ diphosphatase